MAYLKLCVKLGIIGDLYQYVRNVGYILNRSKIYNFAIDPIENKIFMLYPSLSIASNETTNGETSTDLMDDASMKVSLNYTSAFFSDVEHEQTTETFSDKPIAVKNGSEFQ